MSVLGLDSGYTAKYGLNPREFPRAAPSGTPLGSGHISPYIPRLLLIRIQYCMEYIHIEFRKEWQDGMSSESTVSQCKKYMEYRDREAEAIPMV